MKTARNESMHACMHADANPTVSFFFYPAVVGTRGSVLEREAPFIILIKRVNAECY